MRKFPAMLALIAVCLLVAASCDKQNSTQGNQPKVFAMVPKGVHLYYEPCYQGFQDSAARLGVETQYRASPAFELSKQVEIIENLISQHVDGIAISALDDKGLTDVIDRATAAGIKVVTFDAPAPSSKALCYIGTMNDAAGYAGGEKMAALMHGAGSIVLLQGGLGEANLNQRYQGFLRALAEKAPAIKIVGREDTQTRIELAVNKTETLLQAHPDVKGIFCISGEGIPGAASVLKEQNLGGKIILGGFDDLPDSLLAIRNGTAQFCIAQKTYKMGYVALEQLVDAVDGKTLPKQIDTGVQIVDLSNIETYMRDMKAEFASAGPAQRAVSAGHKYHFFTSTNIYQVSRQIAFTAIVALASLFVILTAGIDLSVGSIVGLSGFLAAMAMAAGWGIPASLAIGVLTGATIGAFNGFIIAYIGVTPFIVTLGTLWIGRSLVYIVGHNDSVTRIPAKFIEVGNGQFLHMPLPVCVLIVLAIVSQVILKHTVFGRRIYAIGGNEQATQLSGINTRRVKFFAYVVSGVLCSATAILFIARFSSATADSGKGMELDAIAAAVIGGTSLMGGRGSVIGVLLGATLMGVLRNALVLLDVPANWQDLVIGSIIIVAAIMDVVRNRKAAR